MHPQTIKCLTPSRKRRRQSTSAKDNNWPPVISSLSCISIALLTSVIVSINGADCLSSSQNAGSSLNSNQNPGERVFIVESNSNYHSNNNNNNYSSSNQPNSFKKSNSFKEIFNKLDLQIRENTPIGSHIALIPHPDLDLQNPKTIYAIVDGQDKQSFTLRIQDSSKVELINEVNFDFESEKRHYNILIRATSLYLRYDVDINIYITDENDNKPQLEDFTIVFNNYHQFFPNAPIGKVPVSDLDINDQLRYRILSGNNAQLIVVNETNGEIHLSPWLNGNVPIKAFITIAVSDGINEAVAQLTLIVNLVTEQMLHNSLVLKLDGIGREEFLARKYDKFLQTMTRILNTNNNSPPQQQQQLSGSLSGANNMDQTSSYGTSNIILLDVEEIQQVNNGSGDAQSSNYTNHYGNFSAGRVSLSFSARSYDSQDVEAYLNSQYLEERIQTNRLFLTNELELNVEISRENLCTPDTCKDYQECRPVYVFEKAPRAFIITKNVLFRQIKSLPSYTCSCPAKLDAGALNSSSVCGPCNCDESKGFDGDCDKSTGQCSCKQNHYQPPGSDFCLPCDCYSTGSTQTSCNQTTGQCKCRPGVVGRRCDTCTGSYAEVTQRGCEVIYDECPKTFSDGIWWNRTKLDKLATQQCPPAVSTGTATRFCHRTEGWQRANMFDCISNSFRDLFTQYQFLEENNVPLTTSLAIKIASNLRTALNETIQRAQIYATPTSGEFGGDSSQQQSTAAAAAAARDEQHATLYGSDIYISFRLLHRLILHESRQAGLNLTHSQDRSYIRNLVESMSYILDPTFADNWPEISARSPNGGAEYLLKLIDIYGKVLIESQSDTFTQPFEIQTKYITFGLTTLSSEQLYDQLTHSSAGGKIAFALNQPPSSPPYAVTDPLYGNPEPIHQNTHIMNSPISEYPAYGSNLNNQSRDATQQPPSTLVVPKYFESDATSGASLLSGTRATIPLKTLRIKTIQELMAGSQYQSSGAAAKSRAKRDDLIIPDFRLIKQHQQPALVAYSIWKSLGTLLPGFYDNTVQHKMGMMAKSNSPVVWLTIKPANGSDFLHKNLVPKITYTLQMVEPSRKTRPQCAVWDFNPQINLASQQASGVGVGGAKNGSGAIARSTYGIKQTGKFSTKGCEIKSIQSNPGMRSFKYEYVNCSCDHLGAVTVLMDSAANYADYLTGDNGETSNKDLILTIALLISLTILAAASFVLSCIRGHSIKSNSNTINKNLILVLIAIETLILYNVSSRNSLNQVEYHCKLVAIFLHYFSISLFFWLLVNAIHFYRMLTELRDINHGPMKFYLVIGYAMPAFLVSIAVGLRMEQFGNYIFCWLSVHDPIIWSMFAPISFASIITIALFLLAICKTLPVKEGEDSAQNVELLKNHMLINILKTPLIGLYWLMTVYIVNESVIDQTHYLLPIITVLKSAILFCLLCIIDKHIRFNLYVSWLRFRGKKIPLNGTLVDHQDHPYFMSQRQQWQNSMMFAGNNNLGGDYGIGSRSLLAGNKPVNGGLYYTAGYQTNAPTGGYNAASATPGFQGSCTDIFRPDVLDYSQAASTTSRSTETGTSSSAAYHQYQQHSSRVVREASGYGRTSGGRSKHKRRHKKSHHKHHSSSSKHHHHHHHHRHHHHRSHRHHADYDLENTNSANSLNQDYAHEGRIQDQYPLEKKTTTAAPDLASSHSSDEESTMVRRAPETEQTTTMYKSEEQRTVPMELASTSASGKQENTEREPNEVALSRDEDQQGTSGDALSPAEDRKNPIHSQNQ